MNATTGRQSSLARPRSRARKRSKSAVLPLRPVELGAGKIPYAPGVRAGNWVFATGHMGQDFKNGIPDDVVRGDHPHGGEPKQEKEADIIFKNLAAVMKAGGTRLSNVVRFDQYYSSVEAVHPYHLARFKRFPKAIPPSTSVLMPKMVLPDAEIDVQALAVVTDGDTRIERISNPNRVEEEDARKLLELLKLRTLETDLARRAQVERHRGRLKRLEIEVEPFPPAQPAAAGGAP